jgi:hypothetical protein
MRRKTPSIRARNSDNMTGKIKVKVPLPANDPSGGEAEWVWADPEGPGRYVVRNVPIFAFGFSYGDAVNAVVADGVPVFSGVAQHNGHSTYRIYARTDRSDPRVAELLARLKAMGCDIEVATDKIIGIDVLPKADVHEVYAALEEAERVGAIEFEEGHCGHPLSQ